MIRAGLVCLPFATLSRLQLKACRTRPQRARQPRSVVPRSAAAVRSASRFVTGARCLARAMTAQILLGRAGYPSELRYGVAHKSMGTIDAHAWLVCEGHVVMGEAEAGEFTRLECREA